MIKVIPLFLLSLICSQIQAQSDLVLYSADDYRIGTVLQIIGRGAVVYTSDGYLLDVDIPIGYAGMEVEGAYYATSDCSGTFYVPESSGSVGIIRRGGLHVFFSRQRDEYFKLEWAPKRYSGIDVFPTTECFYDGYGDDYSCQAAVCSNGTRYIQSTAFTAVDENDYGLKPLANPIGYLGYTPPLIPKVVKSDIVYCNSFESCPLAE